MTLMAADPLCVFQKGNPFVISLKCLPGMIPLVNTQVESCFIYFLNFQSCIDQHLYKGQCIQFDKSMTIHVK